MADDPSKRGPRDRSRITSAKTTKYAIGPESFASRPNSSRRPAGKSETQAKAVERELNAAQPQPSRIHGADNRTMPQFSIDDFPITPPIIVKDEPRPRWLMTVEEARDYVNEAMQVGRPAPWRELWNRLTSLASEDEAIEAIDDLRELLEEEDLLLPDGG